MKTFKKIWKFVEDVSAGTLFFTGITLIFYGVIMRYVFNDPKAWVEEVVRYIIIWGVFLGFAIALRNNRHIQVDIVYDKLPPLGRKMLDYFSTLVSMIFCGIYTYYGTTLVVHRYASNMVSMDVGIPMWIVYLILPLSGILFFLRFVERLIYLIKEKEVDYDNPIT